MKAIIAFLISLFTDPKFAPGTPVNHVRHGTVQAVDGMVVAQDNRGVMVEFRNRGRVIVSPTELCEIVQS